MKLHAMRLRPGQDLKRAIADYAREQGVGAGFIVTCVGGLQTVVLRMAGASPHKQDIRTLEGHYEIVSLVGTISPDGLHLHLSVADEHGTMSGGHLKDGSIVFPTAEIVIGEDESRSFHRLPDPATGFDELVP